MKRNKSQSITNKASDRERTIALLGTDLHFDIPISIFRVIKELVRNDYKLLYFACESYKSPFAFDVQANILYNLMSPKIVDGIIVISNLISSPTSPDEFFERCQQFRPLPVVSLGLAFEGIPSVVPDNAAGMYEAVCHLLDVHHLTRIAFLSGQQGHPDVIERFTAFNRAMETHSLPVEESLLLEGNFQRESGTAAVRELLDVRGKVPGRDVQAIVCCNDYMASGVMVELQARGIRIPDEIALVGFDDIPFTACLNPAMSSVHQPFETMAAKATELLMSLIEGKVVSEVESVSARFIPRGSCGCQDTIDHKDNFSDLEKMLKTPYEFSAQLNRQIIDAVKPTLTLWQHALSHLYREDKWSLIAKGADSSPDCGRTAWGLLGNIAYNTFHKDNYQNMIYNMMSSLSSTQELSELVGILTRMLPEAGITRCCVCLYENPENNPAVLPAWSRLILAFSKTGPEELPQGGLRFTTSELLPAEIVRKLGWESWVILALYFREEQLGYVLMDSDAPHEHIHWNLRNQISSALKGAWLLDETRRANNLLVQVNEQKTQFFINVAHETKTPLTLIQNYLALYMEQHEADEQLPVIKENIDLLLSHMLNFLDVERLQKGEMIYRHDTIVDLAATARRKCEMFRVFASKKNIRMTVDAEDRVAVKIDPRALDRIFNNLLDNAVKYVQGGGHIAIDVRRDQDRVMLRISDNGPGLPADTSEHIFEPYYLLSKKKSRQQGIGVGLSIVKKIVDGLGASISAGKSGEGGASITISFADGGIAEEGEAFREIPFSELPSIQIQENIKEKNINPAKHSLLIVDDNIQLLELIQTSFSESYNVFLARNVAEALVKLRLIPRHYDGRRRWFPASFRSFGERGIQRHSIHLPHCPQR
jgi:DNA-binding LacI/PurR family transcriptional regulator/signal transduction histidine kinase